MRQVYVTRDHRFWLIWVDSSGSSSLLRINWIEGNTNWLQEQVEAETKLKLPTRARQPAVGQVSLPLVHSCSSICSLIQSSIFCSSTNSIFSNWVIQLFVFLSSNFSPWHVIREVLSNSPVRHFRQRKFISSLYNWWDLLLWLFDLIRPCDFEWHTNRTYQHKRPWKRNQSIIEATDWYKLPLSYQLFWCSLDERPKMTAETPWQIEVEGRKLKKSLFLLQYILQT